MKKYDVTDTKALDDYIELFKEKYNPAVYENHYAEFLRLIIEMLDDFRQEFEEKFVDDLEEPKEEPPMYDREFNNGK